MDLDYVRCGIDELGFLARVNLFVLYEPYQQPERLPAPFDSASHVKAKIFYLDIILDAVF